jgi:hypothetical protein
MEDGAEKRARETRETGRLSTEYADKKQEAQEAAVSEAAAAAAAAAAFKGQEEGSSRRRERRGGRQRTRTETAANPPRFCMYELLRVLVAPVDASAGRMRVEICALMHKCSCLLVEKETRICASVPACVLMNLLCRLAGV